MKFHHHLPKAVYYNPKAKGRQKVKPQVVHTTEYFTSIPTQLNKSIDKDNDVGPSDLAADRDGTQMAQ